MTRSRALKTISTRFELLNIERAAGQRLLSILVSRIFSAGVTGHRRHSRLSFTVCSSSCDISSSRIAAPTRRPDDKCGAALDFHSDTDIRVVDTAILFAALTAPFSRACLEIDDEMVYRDHHHYGVGFNAI